MNSFGSRDNWMNVFVRLWWMIKYPSPPSQWFSASLKQEFVYEPRGGDGMKHLKVERDDHNVYLTVSEDGVVPITLKMTGREARDAGDSLFKTGTQVPDTVIKRIKE